MAGLKNKETNRSVAGFIESIESESKRADAKKLLSIMQEITGNEPKIWGDNLLIGFGKYKYKRKGGKEEFEWFHVGFCSQKN